tara:strand:- start:1794 stop:2378 length:585 start_codon:yes stop_codon:yes gene_type:complete
MINSKNIFQRINGVISEGLYIKRGSAGQGTGVLYDEVIALLQPFLTKYGIIVIPEKVGEARCRDNKKGNYIYECDFNVTYVNIDNPEDKFTQLVEAHSGDAGDKAPGKAITYAAKISMVKVFQIETGINDESRTEEKNFDLISNDQSMQLFELLVNPETGMLNPKGEKIARAFKFNNISDIKSKKFNEILKAAK